MPAVTPVYGLPYQVGTDPPCFGPGTGCDNLESIWCDFASLVEGQLDENDAVIGRTGTAIPMARLFLRPEPGHDLLLEVFPGIGDLAFDTVVFDTDNMAQLPYIIPQRNGIYRIDATMFVSNPDDNGLITEFQIFVGPDFDVGSMSAYTPVSGQNHFRGSTLYAFTDTSPVPRNIGVAQQSPFANTAVLISASMTVYWHSDL